MKAFECSLINVNYTKTKKSPIFGRSRLLFLPPFSFVSLPLSCRSFSLSLFSRSCFRNCSLSSCSLLWRSRSIRWRSRSNLSSRSLALKEEESPLKCKYELWTNGEVN